MESPTGPFAPGDTVTARGEQWKVSSTDRFAGCAVITLDGAGASNAGVRSTLIAPFDTIAKVVSGKPLRRSRSSTLRIARAAIASARPACGIWTAAAAKVDLLAYQLEPALAVLAGATRVLLADAVGLGKTIQAGLILTELLARGLVDRALILTPAGLRDTWAAELRNRFDLRPIVFDQASVATALHGLPAGVNPWASHAIVIASIDLVKRPEVLATVEGAPFDLVIADEAHHLTPGSDRGAAVERLASRAPWVVLASATPHSGDDAAFNYLTRIGGSGDRITVFRRTRHEVGAGMGRRVHLLAVTPSGAESRMLRAAEAYARAIWNGVGQRDRGARLLAILLARRAASSATALERTLTRRLHLLSGRDDPAAEQASLPWEDAEEGDGDVPAELLGAAGFDDRASEQCVLEELVAAATAARHHASKIRLIARLIRRVREPAVIFTEYRDTLDALVEALGGGHRIRTLHGGLSAGLRHLALSAFTHGDADLLIATDTAGEGLNLHHRCRLVIDVELPWNPRRLEQRVGRVDRLGQTRRVHAIRLLHRGTVEETVLARLERRRVRAAAALDGEPDAWFGEEDVAAAALGAAGWPSRAPARLASAVVVAAAAEVERVARQRAGGSMRAARRAVLSLPRHPARAAARMLLLYHLRSVGPLGRTADESLRALLVELSHRPTTRRDWQARIADLDRDPRVRAVLAHEGLRHAAEIDSQLAALREAVRQRVQVIRDRLHRTLPRELQPSMFDRRVERGAILHQQAIARLDAALRRRIDAVTPAAPPTVPRPVLTAAWPLEV